MNTNKSTSFVQYTRCEVCRIHHNIGVKHVYTKQHQKNLNAFLKRALAKVTECKNCMKTADVHDLEWEKDKRFWCYFCSSEHPKHFPHSDLTVRCLGMIHHFSEHSHYEAVKKFFKENRISGEPTKYIINKSDFLSFMEKFPEAQASYLKKMDVLHKKHVNEIKKAEKRRLEVVEQAVCETVVTDTESCGNQTGTSSQFLLPDKIKPAFTATGGHKIPPWLLPADATSCLASSVATNTHAKPPTIGPTMDDFVEHVRKHQKKRLNPKRVGADFDHSARTSSSWLPSFGRVWSHGPRKQAQKQFKFRIKNRN